MDEVIKTLWGSASSFKDMPDKPAVDLDQTGRAKEQESHLKSPDLVAPTDTTRREDSLLNSRTPLEPSSGQTDSFQAQSPSQERKVNHKEQDRRGRHEPSR